MFNRLVSIITMGGILAFGLASVAQAKTRTETYQGRSYELVTPGGGKIVPRPTVFVLHGGGGTAKKLHQHFSFDKLAAQDGVVLVYPDSANGNWNDGRDAGRKNLFKGAKPNDVVFLSGLADQLVKSGISQQGRIYVIGVSNGGMMTQRLFCEASEQFQAGASIIAGLPVPLKDCAPDSPRSQLLINGDNDPLMPWAGGGVGFRKQRGDVLSGLDSFAHWQRVNGCSGNVKITSMPNTNYRDGTKANKQTALGCAGGSVEMIRVLGGGHNIPGPPTKKPGSKKYKRRAKLLGKYNHDFDARDEIWDFLTRTGL